MEQHTSCPLCESTRILDKYNVDGFMITKCCECSFVFVKEKLTDAYLADYYNSDKTDPKSLLVYKDPSNFDNLRYAYSVLAKKIKALFPEKTQLKILDLGCSNGCFLDEFPEWDCYGIELDDSSAEIAKQRHKNIIVGSMSDANFNENFFDCIVAQDSLDHSNNPMQVILNCHKHLKKDGILVIKVHNINCLLAKVTGKNFYAIIPPQHLSYYNVPTLKLLLERGGYNYRSHYFNTQKLRMRTFVGRAGNTFKGKHYQSFEKFIKNSPIANVPVYKNFHDIVTVFGQKI